MNILNRLILAWIFTGLLLADSSGQDPNPVRIGIFTDCQYCNCEMHRDRYYRLSPGKLDSCIQTFNSLPLQAVFHLGDMIDHGYENYDSILPRFAEFRAPVHLVLGNHDYMIQSEFKEGLTARLGMQEDHYRTDIGGWTFLVLNGDDLSFWAPQSKEQRRERGEMISALYSNLEFNGMIWNGGIGSAQMKWLAGELDSAQAAGRKVIILCHFPLFSREDHNLYNRRELFTLIDRYPCVKAYFNGHYHPGAYTEKDGIHFVNFRGMVDTPENAFCVITLTSDSIRIDGYGREPDRLLKVR